MRKLTLKLLLPLAIVALLFGILQTRLEAAIPDLGLRAVLMFTVSVVVGYVCNLLSEL